MTTLQEISKSQLTDAFHGAAAEMPKLGPKLKENPRAIQHYLIDFLGITVADDSLHYINEPEDPSRDVGSQAKAEAIVLAKAERFSLMKFYVDTQHPHLIDGDGQDARFSFELKRPKDSQGYIEEDFSLGLQQVYRKVGIKEVVLPNKHWFIAGIKRYAQLSRYTGEMASVYGSISPMLTFFLQETMNGAGLGNNTPDLFELINTHPTTKDYDKAQKTIAAHDLAYLSLARATQHVVEFKDPALYSLMGDIVTIDTPDGPKHIYKRVPQQKPGETEQDYSTRKVQAARVHQDVFGGIGRSRKLGQSTSYHEIDFWGPVLKCPVHQPSKENPISNLASQQHAAINAGTEYGLTSFAAHN